MPSFVRRWPVRLRAFARIEAVSRAEAEVRKNRVGLMLQIREAPGPELWRKLEAAMPVHHFEVKRRIQRLRPDGDGAPNPREDDGR